MNANKPPGLFKLFSTGSEIWMHRTAIVLVAIRNIALLAIFFGLVAGGLYLYFFVDRELWHQIYYCVLAHLRQAIFMTATPMSVVLDGQTQSLPVADVIALTDPVWGSAAFQIRQFLIVSGTTALCVCVLIAGYWYNFGQRVMEKKEVRGATMATAGDLTRIIRDVGPTSPYTIAGVPMLHKAETLHTIVVGAQGTGKSQAFFDRMRQIRRNERPAIVYDPSGEFTEAFFREGRDIMLNPFDERSPNWNVRHEIVEDYHYDGLANGLIPDPREADPFWSLAGREVFRDVVKTLHADGQLTNQRLYTSLAMSSLDQVYELLRNTAGASYVDPKTERTGMSLKMTVQNQLSSFRFLRDDGPPFSIRQWIYGKQDDVNRDDSWIFISTREEMREAIKPVLSLWMDISIKSMLNLKPIHRERLHFLIDELPTLQKLDIMKLLLTNTRKYGACAMLGLQDLAQLLEIYGEHLASTIVSGCQSKLLLRVTDDEATRKFAKLIGETEFEEQDESLSFGLDSQRDGFSLASRRKVQDLLLSSQIRRLPDMTGYLVYPGDYPVARVSYSRVEYPAIAEPFVRRDPNAAFGKPASGAGGAVASTDSPGAAPNSPQQPTGNSNPADWVSHPEALAFATGGVDPETGEILPPRTGGPSWPDMVAREVA